MPGSDGLPNPKPFLFFGLLATYAGLMLANPVFPPLARELGLTEFQAGLIVSASALVFAAGSPLWGSLSERIGRKPVFVMGLIGAGLGMALFAVVAQAGSTGFITGGVLLAALLLARVTTGLFMGGAPVAAQAYMADITESSDRSAGMALIGAANGIGTLLGPALAALLVTFGLLLPFYAGAAVILLAALALALVMPASPRRQSFDAPPRLRPWDRRVWPFLFLGFATVIVIVLLQVTLGFYLIDRFAFSPVEAAQMSGVALFVVGIALALVQGVFVTRFKWSPRALLRAGMPIMAIGLCGAVLAPELPHVIAAFAVMGGRRRAAVPRLHLRSESGRRPCRARCRRGAGLCRQWRRRGARPAHRNRPLSDRHRGPLSGERRAIRGTDGLRLVTSHRPERSRNRHGTV
jgi:MFS family permease